ncbi:uncharacterized protein TNCV_4764491, partial [Trichonephila clavipes]
EKNELTSSLQESQNLVSGYMQEKNKLLGEVVGLESQLSSMTKVKEEVSAVPGFWPDDRRTASLVGLCGGWRHARTKLCTRSYGSNAAVPGISGDPKSVRKLPSSVLLIETASAVQSKYFLMAKTFLDSTLTVSPHKSLNSSRGVISESDLLCASETEILERLSDQGVTQDRRITIKKDSKHLPTKHRILTFNSPKLPATIKTGYLNCKICPYIPNPLRCFQCPRFGHSQTSCRGQLTCSRCASAGHSSMDCRAKMY